MRPSNALLLSTLAAPTLSVASSDTATRSAAGVSDTHSSVQLTATPTPAPTSTISVDWASQPSAPSDSRFEADWFNSSEKKGGGGGGGGGGAAAGAGAAAVAAAAAAGGASGGSHSSDAASSVVGIDLRTVLGLLLLSAVGGGTLV